VSAALDPQRVGAWCAQAACRGRTSLFYSEDIFSIRLALAVCKGCPVRPECTADAMATEAPGLRYGVVAGTTPQQRAGWG
jgi:hypothetical protein